VRVGFSRLFVWQSNCISELGRVYINFSEDFDYVNTVSVICFRKCWRTFKVGLNCLISFKSNAV
jgi:hypothetical protein